MFDVEDEEVVESVLGLGCYAYRVATSGGIWRACVGHRSVDTQDC